jgi:hypothetical protein
MHRPLKTLLHATALTLALLHSWQSVLAQEAAEYRVVEWVELIPDDDLAALLLPPQWLDEIDDGSRMDDPALFGSREQESEADKRYRQALESTAVRGELADQKVRIPGFIVPLTYDDQRRVIEFFLVPYMGACLHLPPPPPNQIIHVDYELGLPLDSLWEPYWVEGVLEIKTVSHFLGEAAYAIDAQRLELYEY